MRVVLMLAAGADWESRALGLLGDRRDLVVLKRCVDVDDLLATATSRQADTAVVALEVPGFALAAALGRTTRTTLIDADPYGGTVAQVLGVLDEVSGLLAAARLAGSGMLEERFAGVQRALDQRFTVVTGIPRPDRWTEVRPG